MTPLRAENPIPEEAQNWQAPEARRDSDVKPEIEARPQAVMETWNGLSQEARTICLNSLDMDDVSFERWTKTVADSATKAKPAEAAMINDKLRTYRQMRQELTDLIQSNPDLLTKLQKPASPEQIDLKRLGFAETTFQRLPSKGEKSGKMETFAFQRIAGNHSWESGLKAAGNQLKEGIALGLKVKYPDQVQALHLLREMKRQVGRETNVGTFIDEPGGYMILHGDKPSTRTTALDRSLDYPHTEMMVLVVPDTPAVPSTEARPGKKVA